MRLVSRIKRYLQNFKNLQKTRFQIVSVAPEILKGYNDSLGWYLEKLSEQADFPKGIISLSTIGKDEKALLAYFDVSEVKRPKIMEYLKTCGIFVEI